MTLSEPQHRALHDVYEIVTDCIADAEEDLDRTTPLDIEALSGALMYAADLVEAILANNDLKVGQLTAEHDSMAGSEEKPN